MASLDVELPERGVDYLFTTPLGDIRITAQAVAASQVDRFIRLAWIVAALVVLAAGYKFILYVNAALSRRFKAAALILVGIASAVSGFFPIAGVVAIVVGAALLFRRAAAVRTSPQAQTS